jgi:hypothetical protein
MLFSPDSDDLDIEPEENKSGANSDNTNNQIGA